MEMELLILMVCMTGIMLVLIVAAVALIIVKAGQQPKNAEELAAVVESLMPKVRPWQTKALIRLRTYNRGNWAKFGRSVTMRGLLAATSSPKEPAWAAFAVRGRLTYRRPFSFHGQALVRTTEHTFEFDSQPTGVVVRLDGRPLGTLRPDGVLLGTDERPIGHFPLEDKRGEIASPLTLHGKVVARLTRPNRYHFGFPFLSRRKRPLPPAVEVLDPFIDSHEANWLPALVFWQIVNLAVRRIGLRSGIM